MEETIIIYTKYYSEAVIEIIERYDLNIQIICLSSYNAVYSYLTNTPNIRGIIFLEYRATKMQFGAYKKILQTADEISESSKQPFCISIISNNDNPRKFLSQISTKFLDILFTKFTFFNTDLLRFEGISAVILNTIGVANQSITLGLIDSTDSDLSNTSSLKAEFLRLCLDITVTDTEELGKFNNDIKRFPELNKLINIRNSNEFDSTYLDNAEGLFKLFLNKGIARREHDEAKNSFRY